MACHCIAKVVLMSDVVYLRTVPVLCNDVVTATVATVYIILYELENV